MATGYHARGCRPEGALWLVASKGERTESDQQTGGFSSVRQEREDPRGVDSRSRGARGRGPRRGGLPQPRGRGERTQEGWTPAAEGPGGEDPGGVHFWVHL